jgi:hypothetical protein
MSKETSANIETLFSLYLPHFLGFPRANFAREKSYFYLMPWQKIIVPRKNKKRKKVFGDHPCLKHAPAYHLAPARSKKICSTASLQSAHIAHHCAPQGNLVEKQVVAVFELDGAQATPSLP